MASLAEPRQPAAGLKGGDAIALAGLLGQRGFGQRLAGKERGRRSSGCSERCRRATRAERSPYVKFICRNQPLPLQVVGSRLLVSAHSSRRQQDVEVLLLLQPLGFWLSCLKCHLVPSCSVSSTQQRGGLQGSLCPGDGEGSIVLRPGCYPRVRTLRLLLPLTYGGNWQHLCFG